MLLKGAVKAIFLLLLERIETADSDTILELNESYSQVSYL